MPLLCSLLGNWKAQVQKWKQYQKQRQISGRLCVILSKQACNVTLGNLLLAIKATES